MLLESPGQTFDPGMPENFLKWVGKKGIDAAAPIFFTLPPLLLSFPTLSFVFWVGKRASLPTQITKFM